MSCKYSCSRDLFSIWIFALSEVMCTLLPMPLDCGLLSVNMWLSLWSSVGVRDTAGDEHWKHNWKVMQLPMWTRGHWAIYNLSVFPSFGSVCLFSVFIKQSWYPLSSLHAKGDWAALAPFDFLGCAVALMKRIALSHCKKKAEHSIEVH